MNIEEAYTFDDVLLQPAHSKFGPADADVKTFITKDIKLNIPLLSAAMDTVTEHRLAITMAQLGGMGVLHKNFSIKEQVSEVKKVKKFESGMVVNPVTIKPDQTLGDAFKLMEKYKISGIPVVEGLNNKLVGILTNRDVRFANDLNQSVSALMTKNVITVKETVTAEDARKLLHKHRIEKLVVVDMDDFCVGLITVKDMEKAQNHPDSCKDEQGRLRVAAATGVGKDGIKRAEALINAGVDVLIVDTAHGHSEMVLETVRAISKLSSQIALIGGNVATGDATRALIDAGANGIKVGIGPGSICTTRMVAGVGVPQLTAITDCAKVAKKKLHSCNS
jgi:IMP dehydrogenase